MNKLQLSLFFKVLQNFILNVSRDGRGGFSSAGPTSLPGPGANYMHVGSGSPRNLASSRRDSLEQNYSRYPSGGFEGPHSLPYSLHQQYQDGTGFQVHI